MSEQTGFRAALERLIEAIDGHGEAEDATEIRSAALEALADPLSDAEDDSRPHRLRDALHRFETDHPDLTRAINDVSHFLSGMGI